MIYGKSYRDLGYSKFLTKQKLIESLSPQEARNLIPYASLSGDALAAQSLQNEKIGSYFRNHQAVVALDGSGDFTDIQEAVTYLEDILGTGGSIYIKSGTYEMSGDINIGYTVPISLQGDGFGATVLDFGNQSFGIKAPYSLEKFSILMGTWTSGSQGISINDLVIKNSTDSDGAIELGANRYSKIKCIFENNTLDIKSVNNYPLIVENCISYQSSAFFSDVTVGWKIVNNNRIEDCQGEAITVLEGADGFNTEVSGNQFYKIDDATTLISIENYASVGNRGLTKIVGNHASFLGGINSCVGINVKSGVNDAMLMHNHLIECNTPITNNGTNTLSTDNVTV